jgi:hypothetical protein
MKTALIISVIFLICINPISGQNILDEISFHESSYFYVDIHTQERLFVRKNIANAKVCTVYIIQTSGKRDSDGNAQIKDTLYRYEFDSLGRIKSADQYYDKKFSPLFIETDDRNLLMISKERDTTITIYKTYQGDTSHIIEKTFSKGNLIHHTQNPTQSHLKRITCLTGEYINNSYSYDSLNRINMISVRSERFYTKIEYVELGAIIRRYDTKSNAIINSDSIFFLQSNTQQIIAGRNIYINKKIENGLILYMTVLEGPFPQKISYYECEYHY